MERGFQKKQEVMVPAYYFRTQLGVILEAVSLDRKFIVTHRGKPTGIFLNLRTYLAETGKRLDVEDDLETLTEEMDPVFQRSLERAKKEMLSGKYLSLDQVKKKLRK